MLKSKKIVYQSFRTRKHFYNIKKKTNLAHTDLNSVQVKIK